MEKRNIEILLQTTLRRSAALIGNRIVHEGLIFILLLRLARTNPENYGLILFSFSVASLLRAIQGIGFDQYTLRDLSTSPPSSTALLEKMIRIKTLLAIVIIIGLLGFAQFKCWSFQQTSIVFILLASQLLEGIADTYFNLFRAEGQSVNESIRRTVPILIASLYGAACLFLHLNILFFSLLFLINSSLKYLAAKYGASKLHIFSQLSNKPFKLKAKQIQAIFLIAAINFFGIFYNEVQTLLVRQYHTLIEVAQYKVASDMTNTLCGIFANLIIGAVLFPLLVASTEHKDKFNSVTREYFKRIIVIGSGVACFIALFNGRIIHFIFGTEYETAVAIAPLFGAAAFFSFINNFIIYVILAMRKEKQLLLFLCVPVSISILIGPVLVSRIDSLGAALSLLLCRVLLSIILVTFLQKKIQLFKLTEYRNVMVYWMIAVTVFLLLGQFSYFISSCLALLVYFLLLWKSRIFFQIGKEVRVEE